MDLELFPFIFEHLSRLGIGNASDFILGLFISFLIGIVSLTWLYVLDCNDEHVSKKWACTRPLEKVIISLLVGGSSYLFALSFRTFTEIVNPSSQLSIFNYTWIIF